MSDNQVNTPEGADTNAPAAPPAPVSPRAPSVPPPGPPAPHAQLLSNTSRKGGVMWHMAYILTFYIFLPSLNNNIIFIFSSYFIKHTLALFF